jgi:hypothetical protein
MATSFAWFKKTTPNQSLESMLAAVLKLKDDL